MTYSGIRHTGVHRARGDIETGLRQASGLVEYGHHTLRVPHRLCPVLWRDAGRVVWPHGQRRHRVAGRGGLGGPAGGKGDYYFAAAAESS